MTDPKPTTVNEYVATLPEDKITVVQKVRETIKQTIPEAKEVMSYNMPTYDLDGHHLVYFGAWKDHIGMYPLYIDGGELKDLFEPYNKVNNSIHLPYNDPKLYDIIREFCLFRKQEEIDHPSHS